MPQKKRDHGDGSIYKRESDGKWVGSIKPTHSSKRKVFYGKTELEVKKKLKAFIYPFNLKTNTQCIHETIIIRQDFPELVFEPSPVFFNFIKVW